MRYDWMIDEEMVLMWHGIDLIAFHYMATAKHIQHGIFCILIDMS